MKINQDLRDYDEENDNCNCLVGIVIIGFVTLFIGVAIGIAIAPYFN